MAVGRSSQGIVRGREVGYGQGQGRGALGEAAEVVVVGGGGQVVVGGRGKVVVGAVSYPDRKSTRLNSSH